MARRKDNRQLVMAFDEPLPFPAANLAPRPTTVAEHASAGRTYQLVMDAASAKMRIAEKLGEVEALAFWNRAVAESRKAADPPDHLRTMMRYAATRVENDQPIAFPTETPVYQRGQKRPQLRSEEASDVRAGREQFGAAAAKWMAAEKPKTQRKGPPRHYMPTGIGSFGNELRAYPHTETRKAERNAFQAASSRGIAQSVDEQRHERHKRLHAAAMARTGGKPLGPLGHESKEPRASKPRRPKADKPLDIDKPIRLDPKGRISRAGLTRWVRRREALAGPPPPSFGYEADDAYRRYVRAPTPEVARANGWPEDAETTSFEHYLTLAMKAQRETPFEKRVELDASAAAHEENKHLGPTEWRKRLTARQDHAFRDYREAVRMIGVADDKAWRSAIPVYAERWHKLLALLLGAP